MDDGCDGNLICDKPLDTCSLDPSGDRGATSGNEGTSSQQQQARETHSCPSSPTETDCSSGFSTLRRRSVTLTEKVRH